MTDLREWAYAEHATLGFSERQRQVQELLAAYDALSARLAQECALRAQAEQERDEVREQHTKVWNALKTTGLPIVDEPRWRDAEFREWELRLERTVECPDCGFSFGAGHTDDKTGTYSCPVCADG